ncbi:MAG TPA: diguanylate cyclase, partial [Bryobacteraceae bacterium]|nr:diguanylate cyclase [Bryobacteraceae bacterium]
MIQLFHSPDGSHVAWIIAIASLLAAFASISVWLTARRRLWESFEEIENLSSAARVVEEERRMLELIAKGAGLQEVLNTLTLAIERLVPGCLCTVMLLDEESRQFLSIASGPSLPDAYLQALRHIGIGPEAGACGSAAFRNETVVVEDIARDPRFAEARDLILGYGLRSCWSEPIRDSGGAVLGTFAMYHRHPAAPRLDEMRKARAAAQLAGNAIERIRAGKALSKARRRLNLAERVARFGVWETNFDAATMTISEGAAAILEVPPGKLKLTVAEFEAMIHPDDLDALQAAWNPVNAHEETVQNEFRLALPGGSIRWIRSLGRFEGDSGRGLRAIGALIDVTEEKKLLAQSQEERAAAESSARDARTAERLLQDRKAILELVAKDRPLDQIVLMMAEAIGSHIAGSLCSIQVDLSSGSRLAASPGFPEPLADLFSQLPLASIRLTSRAEPIANFSAEPAWREFVESAGALPFQHYRAVPVLRQARTAGVIASFLGPGMADDPAGEKLLESWGQVASLAAERRGFYEQLSFRARHDPLTGLLNRAALYDRLGEEIGKSAAAGHVLAILYLDLDHFKEINDQHGHAAGDRVLQ